MRRYTSRRPLATLTELNITPLLDLAFVLLIIFMITTPLIETRLDLVVPTSTTADAAVDPDKVLIVEVSRTGSLLLDNVPMAPEQLEAQLAEFRAEKPGVSVVVRPDRELPVQRFINVMDILNRVGIGKVGVMTRPETPPEGP
jgi:biopolymer transport protein ExbD